MTCAGCGVAVDPSETYFSARGEVCATCEARESSRDSAAFAAGAERGLDAEFSYFNPLVFTVQTSRGFTFSIGAPLGIVFNVLRWLLRPLYSRSLSR